MSVNVTLIWKNFKTSALMLAQTENVQVYIYAGTTTIVAIFYVQNTLL